MPFLWVDSDRDRGSRRGARLHRVEFRTSDLRPHRRFETTLQREKPFVSSQAPPAVSPAPAADPPRPRAGLAVLAVYTAAIFTSAFLLFLVQPMFSRMVLPLLGGTPAVWNTCMLFFQAALLGGYLYAHLGAKRLGVRRQAAAHVV